MWLERCYRVAEIIGTKPGRVMDLGAGHRCILNFIEPTSYHPYDLIDGFDLNKSYPEPIQVDWAISLGLLEYLEQPSRLIEKVKDYTNKMIVTYNCRMKSGRYHKFRNHYTQREIETVFEKCNWCYEMQCISQCSTIYKLSC